MRSPSIPDQVYNGLVSYSHAADGLLVLRLQSALQRFAKPWWKRKSVPTLSSATLTGE